MDDENRMKFAACDYSATGEGRTICILITYLHPLEEDYETKPSWKQDEDGKWQYTAGVLKSSEEDIIYREFAKIFGGYMAMGIEHLTRLEFVNRFGRFVPEFILRSINEPMGNFRYFTEIHYNLS